MHMEVRPFIHLRREKIAGAFRIPVLCLSAFADQSGAAIEIPSDDEDRRARFDERLAQSAEVAGGIDQDGGPFGPLETPDVAIGDENHTLPMGSGPDYSASPPSNARVAKWSPAH